MKNDEIDITGVGLFDLDRVLDPSEPLNKDLVIAPPDFSVFYIGFNASAAAFRRSQVQAGAHSRGGQGPDRKRGAFRVGYTRPSGYFHRDSQVTTPISKVWSTTRIWPGSF